VPSRVGLITQQPEQVYGFNEGNRGHRSALELMGMQIMISLINRSSLCIDVYLKNNYIGEIARAEETKWTFTQTVRIGLNDEDLMVISKQLFELNKAAT